MPSDILFKDLVKRAWHDTRAEIGWSWGMAVRSCVAFIGIILFHYWFKSEADAMSVWEEGLYSFLIFIALVFLPCFLWNLWLAPYRILSEHFDRASDRLGRGSSTSQSDLPKPANFAEYRQYMSIELHGAACLWVGLEPHHPLKDSRARAKLGQLKSAVRGGVLVCKWKNNWKEFATGITDQSPTDHQPVSMTALRKYADSIGDVPKFLEHVSVSSTEENNRQSGKKTP